MLDVFFEIIERMCINASGETMTDTRPALAHLGIFVSDLPAMVTFYTGVFGLLITDRGVGNVFKNELVFLSGAADQHHQIVLSSGRLPGTPSTVMQLSFKVASLDALRRSRDLALEHGATDLIGLNHGNAWSVYFHDPEGNRIELYLDTPFHTPQPCGEPLDLEMDDEALLEETRALVEGRQGSMSMADFTRSMQDLLA